MTETIQIILLIAVGLFGGYALNRMTKPSDDIPDKKKI